MNVLPPDLDILTAQPQGGELTQMIMQLTTTTAASPVLPPQGELKQLSNSNRPHAPSSKKKHIKHDIPQLLSVMEWTLLGLPDNSAYLTALETCPQLLSKECSLVRFLQFCDYDAIAASKRLVAYWNMRLDWFGPDRAYLPMTILDGIHGALDAETLHCLQQEMAYLLPPNSKGQMVILTDYSNTTSFNKRIGMNAPTEQRKKIIFFLLQLVSHEPTSLEGGAVFLQLIREKQHSYSPDTLESFKLALLYAVPLRISAFHILVVPRNLPEQPRQVDKFVKKAVPYMWQFLKGKLGFTMRTMDVLPLPNTGCGGKAQQQEELAELLRDRCGLRPDGMPLAAGGVWSFARLKHILALQTTTTTNAASMSGEDEQEDGFQVYSKLPTSKREEDDEDSSNHSS